MQIEASASKKNINEVRVNWDKKWKRRLLEKIKRNLDFDASEFYSHEKLIDINMAGIKWAVEKMNITTPMIFSSQLDVDGSKSALNANLVRAVGGTKYISGPSGKDYLDMTLFDDIEVEFFQPKVDNYYSCLYNLLSKQNQRSK